MELLGFSLVEVILLVAGFVVLAAAMQMARVPKTVPAGTRVAIALVLVALIAGSWGSIRAATRSATEAAMRAARRHGVTVGVAAEPKAADGLRGKQQMAGKPGGAKPTHPRQPPFAWGRAGSAAAEPEEEQGEEGEEEEEEQGQEAEGPEQRAETPEELFHPGLLEGEGEAEYGARRLRADAELSRRAAVEGMVGGARASSASLMLEPRQVEEAARWVGGDAKLSRMLTLEGLRSHTASTLFAKEDYAELEQANHGYGEGMDLRYVDPSLRNFDYAFAAYDDKPLPPNPLPGNAPIHF
jgi:hypothetical protein